MPLARGDWGALPLTTVELHSTVDVRHVRQAHQDNDTHDPVFAGLRRRLGLAIRAHDPTCLPGQLGSRALQTLLRFMLERAEHPQLAAIPVQKVGA
jgi:hypothetical protein